LTDSKQKEDRVSITGEAAIIRQMEQAIKGGKHWYLALLEAIAQWESPEEILEERKLKYLIAGEAFDWLLLAERLCLAVNDLIPETEKIALLFRGDPPLNLPPDKFKEIIGDIKYHQYLNFFYGITVEEALAIAIEEEVRKERWIAGYHRDSENNTSEAYRRIYGATKSILLRHFRQEMRYPQLRSISLTELKEFTYWLFKRRVKLSDKARVASDTRKALEWLGNKVYSRWLDRRAFEMRDIEALRVTEIPPEAIFNNTNIKQ
jgi:hypothetical protein